MSTLFDERNREIIPRWRNSEAALHLGEMKPLHQGEPRDLKNTNRLRALVHEWEEARTLSFAADLINEAFLSGSNPAVVDAARYIIERAPRGPSNDIIALAEQLLVPDEIEQPRISLVSEDQEEPEFWTRIRRLRHSLRKYPRNAFAWADLAHAYGSIGAVRRAMDAMDVALKLAPGDRYILRSAARLAIHADLPERALIILRRGPGQRDPWIAGAEIAVSSLFNEPAKFIGIGRRMVESTKLSHFHKAEVSSAVATLEGANGAAKRAKKIFRQSLVDPTENAVAQAEWASNRLVRFEVKQELLERPDTFEARTIDAFSRGAFLEAYTNCWKWLIDQPFSNEPARDGSFFASVGLEDHEAALRIIAYAEAANPRDWLLLNNKAFALLNLSRVAEAEQVLSYNRPDRNDQQQYGTWLATNGMLQFRKGNTARGRELYKAALEEWSGDTRSMALAALFWAREEILAAKDGAYRDAFSQAIEAAKDERSPDIELLLKRIMKLHDDQAERMKQLALAGAESSGS